MPAWKLFHFESNISGFISFSFITTLCMKTDLDIDYKIINHFMELWKKNRKNLKDDEF